MKTEIDKEQVTEKARLCRLGKRSLLLATGEQRKQSLLILANNIDNARDELKEVNQLDYEVASSAGLSSSFLDRMLLSDNRIDGIIESIGEVALLPDPVFAEIEKKTAANGLEIKKIRVPLGVIGVIYESRPNVTIDLATLCIKSGNGLLLRGGSDCLNTNVFLTKLVKKSLEKVGIDSRVVQIVESKSHDTVSEMLALREYIDLIIPRGGTNLVKHVREHATMPSITGGIGVSHAYVDEFANMDVAVSLVHNSKVNRPSTCNSLDTALVNKNIASEFIPRMVEKLGQSDVEIRVDEGSFKYLGKQSSDQKVTAALEDDFGTEFLDLIISVKVVNSIDDALKHIEKYGSGHTDLIISNNIDNINKFVQEVDSAAVMVNSSTRFHDGNEFGLGSEVAISTDKFHARGPLGINEICSYKWVVRGKGQTRV